MLFSEPKIPQCYQWYASLTLYYRFQCSSASRKFLNLVLEVITGWYYVPFQCSSASRKFLNRGVARGIRIFHVFQCSSASRKFLNKDELSMNGWNWCVSVLFSEPKIPQFVVLPAVFAYFTCFSALQRAENSSIDEFPVIFRPPRAFQCSSASRKFLNNGNSQGSICR